jgi:hypothetical protein
VAELRQRWQFIVSRWGYATSVFAWELANENDDWSGWGPQAQATQVALAAFIAS